MMNKLSRILVFLALLLVLHPLPVHAFHRMDGSETAGFPWYGNVEREVFHSMENLAEQDIAMHCHAVHDSAGQ
jgi:hypothetical protein